MTPALPYSTEDRRTKHGTCLWGVAALVASVGAALSICGIQLDFACRHTLCKFRRMLPYCLGLSDSGAPHVHLFCSLCQSVTLFPDSAGGCCTNSHNTRRYIRSMPVGYLCFLRRSLACSAISVANASFTFNPTIARCPSPNAGGVERHDKTDKRTVAVPCAEVRRNVEINMPGVGCVRR